MATHCLWSSHFAQSRYNVPDPRKEIVCVSKSSVQQFRMRYSGLIDAPALRGERLRNAAARRALLCRGTLQIIDRYRIDLRTPMGDFVLYLDFRSLASVHLGREEGDQIAQIRNGGAAQPLIALCRRHCWLGQMVDAFVG